MKLLPVTLISLFAAVLACLITLIAIEQGGAGREWMPFARWLLERDVYLGILLLFVYRVLVIVTAQGLAALDERLGVLVYLCAILNLLDAGNNLLAL